MRRIRKMIPRVRRIILHKLIQSLHHTGHKSIADRALAIFSRVIIGVGYNIAKPGSENDAHARADAIARIYRDDPRVEVCCYTGLTTDAARSHGADTLLRAVRNYTDFEYERDMAGINRRLSGMETLIMFSLPEYENISSSIVRQLGHFGADTTPFIP